ncbi:MAG: hypothetical protein QOI99_435 [Actinomycetota bacterium]|nr:hypothetical protein [Actinomycetota bacterium]
MRLSRDAFDTVFAALDDAFSAQGDFALLARCIDTRLQDITGANASNRDIVMALIECAENGDSVDRLVACAKEKNPDNRLLADIDVATLTLAPAPSQVVESGGGTGTFKARLLETLGTLGTPGLQDLAGHELTTLLDGGSEAEAETLYLALLGTVRTQTGDEVLDALTPVIGAALRRRVGSGKRPDGVDVDLARARLRRIDMSGVDLHEADLAFADLRHANLANANLWRSRAYAVDVTKAGLSGANLEEVRWHACIAREAGFHDCRMVAAFFKEADLVGAEFQGSRLQGAHFERADLTGASFEGANLADAYFEGATIDQVAATSIAKAKNWAAAHLDPAAHELVSHAATP